MPSGCESPLTHMCIHTYKPVFCGGTSLMSNVHVIFSDRASPAGSTTMQVWDHIVEQVLGKNQEAWASSMSMRGWKTGEFPVGPVLGWCVITCRLYFTVMGVAIGKPGAIEHTRGTLAASPWGPAKSLCNQSAAQSHIVGKVCTTKSAGCTAAHRRNSSRVRRLLGVRAGLRALPAHIHNTLTTAQSIAMPACQNLPGDISTAIWTTSPQGRRRARKSLYRFFIVTSTGIALKDKQQRAVAASIA